MSAKDIVELAGRLDVRAVNGSPRPWQQEMVGANASGGFHLYLIDATGKKIAALWGGADEKSANGLLILGAVEAFDGKPPSKATSPSLNVPTLSATERALKIAVEALRRAENVCFNQANNAAVRPGDGVTSKMLLSEVRNTLATESQMLRAAIVQVDVLVPGVVK